MSNRATAGAPTFALLATSRVLGGAAHALFFSISIGYAARLVLPAQTGRAMALVSVGVSGGLVVGVPLSTAVGNALGWRVAFVLLGVVMLVVLGLVAAVLPAVPAPVRRAREHPGRRRDVAAVVAANGFVYLGHFVLYTFISTLLLASGADPAWVALLLVFGLCGLGGLRIGAAQLDTRPWASALAVPAVMAIGITAVGVGFPSLWAVVVAGALWSAALGPAPSLYQTVAVRTDAIAPELAGAWINASSNAGIAGGAVIGGAVLAAQNLRAVTWLAAALVLTAAFIALARRSVFEAPPADAAQAVERDRP